MKPKRSRSPDIFVCMMSMVGGFIVFTYLHNKWFHGGWMMLFGDPPSLNFAYKSVSKLFLAAPFAGSGIATGLIAGVGYATDWQGIALRVCAVVLTCFVVNRSVPPLGYSVFLPTALLCFTFGAVVSWLYGVLLLRSLEQAETQQMAHE
jgi:hypothetical protein